MSNVGWIKLHRQLQESPLWHSEPFSKAQAWIDLIMLMNHEDNKILFDNQLIEVKRGQHMTSYRKLSVNWKWSIGKVKRFIELLSNDNMVKVESFKNGTLLTLVNYELYQGEQNTNGTPTEHQRNTDGTPTEHGQNINETQTETNNNEKNDKNDKNDKNEKNNNPPISPQGENRSSKKTREINPTETDIEIIDYLNFVCDKSFRPSKSNIEYIHGRLSEGYTIDDFRKVIDIKAKKWKNNPDMNEYLRPSTLFAPKKFDNYLNEKPKESVKTRSQLIDEEMAGW